MWKYLKSVKNNRFVRALFYLFKGKVTPAKSKFLFMGEDVIITPPIHIGNPQNVGIGKGVGIGPNAFITAVNAKFVVKGNCAIAEGLTVHTGNHARMIGKFISDVKEKEKPEGYDKDVIIEKDVWIGSNVTLLSGVTIGRGATIAAGAVVNKNIPPYCIAGGIPARPIKFYWTVDEVLQHELELYNEDERLSREEIEKLYKQYE